MLDLKETSTAKKKGSCRVRQVLQGLQGLTGPTESYRLYRVLQVLQGPTGSYRVLRVLLLTAEFLATSRFWDSHYPRVSS